MHSSPDIAVMMMTYNNEADIRQSLETLAGQSYQNFHLVFVDDCSPDRSFAIAEEYRGKFPHVTMLRNGANKGVIRNLYDTLRFVEETVPQAEFFIWACADDWWEPTFLEKTRQRLLDNPKAAVCQTWFDTLHVATGTTTLHKLCPVRGSSYREAAQIFRKHYSDADPTYFNFTLHGLMRRRVLRDIYPDDPQKIAYSASTELSGLIAMILHGGIDIVPERLIHRREYGRFIDNNPQDTLGRYYRNIPLRMWAALSHLPRFVKIRRRQGGPFLVLLLVLHLLVFYGVAPAYVVFRDFIRTAVFKNALTRDVSIVLSIITGAMP